MVIAALLVVVAFVVEVVVTVFSVTAPQAVVVKVEVMLVEGVDV